MANCRAGGMTVAAFRAQGARRVCAEGAAGKIKLKDDQLLAGSCRSFFMDKKMKKEAVAKFAESVRAGVDKVELLSSFELEAEEAKRQVGQAMVDKNLADMPDEDGK